MSAPTDVLAQQLYGQTTGAPQAGNPESGGTALGGPEHDAPVTRQEAVTAQVRKGEPANVARDVDDSLAWKHWSTTAIQFGKRLADEILPDARLLPADQREILDVSLGRAALHAGLFREDHLAAFKVAMGDPRTSDPAQREALQRETLHRLRERYGDKAEAALDLANRFVKRDARLAKLLNDSGAGNHLAVVEMFIERAHEARKRGDFE